MDAIEKLIELGKQVSEERTPYDLDATNDDIGWDCGWLHKNAATLVRISRWLREALPELENLTEAEQSHDDG